MKYLLMVLSACLFMVCSCSDVSGPIPQSTREESIQDGAVKITPDTDIFPPVIHSTEWSNPIPVPGPINTAGVEDAAVISADGSILIFFFTPDGNLPAVEQLHDGASGIWWCRKTGTGWTKPVRALLADSNEDHLDGSLAFTDTTLWFCSARQGNYNPIDLYTAELDGDQWINWQNAGQQLNGEYKAGELYATSDGDSIYFAGNENGHGQSDIWLAVKNGTGWSYPVNLEPPVNTIEDEGQPFISADGNELWFTRMVSSMGYYGPAIFRSVRSGKTWSEPVEIVSSYVGDPRLDDRGNLYFTHLFYDANHNKIEADIYVAYRL